MKAADRRDLILHAAMEEYGRVGMLEASTEVIAARAGVSQPYLFRLFGTKTDLIVGAIGLHTTTLTTLFSDAVAQRDPGTTPLAAMGEAYKNMLHEQPNSLRCQLHAWAAASADPKIGTAARESYLAVWRHISELSGESPDAVREFLAHGMLLTVVAALDVPEILADPDY